MSDYKEDKTGTLEETFTEVCSKYFEELKCLKFQYIWRKKDKVSKHGCCVQATVFKLSPKMRDITGFDIQVEVHKDSWPENRKLKRKLAYHELKHIELKRDEDGAISLDKSGRIKYTLIPHDISILRFKDELDVFGVDHTEAEVIRGLYDLYKKSKDKKSKDKRGKK